MTNSDLLCLPIEVERIIVYSVHDSMSIEHVKDAFNMMHLAEIESAVLVPRSVGGKEPYCNAILTVKNWRDTKSAKKFQLNLREKEKEPWNESVLVYDTPWYWVIKEDIEFYKNDFKLEFNFKQIDMTNISNEYAV